MAIKKDPLDKNEIFLETERFFLRILKPEDVSSDYVSWLSEKDARKFIEAAKLTQTTETLKDFVREKWDDPNAFLFGIFDKASQKHIGNLKYEPVDTQEKFAIMGILVGNVEYRGKGVAGETIQSTSLWLKENLGVEEIVLDVDLENEPAIKAYEKIGFKKQAATRYHPKEGHASMTWTP